MSTGNQLTTFKGPSNELVNTSRRVGDLLNPETSPVAIKIKSSLPSHMNGDHFMRMAIFNILAQPKLLGCTEISIVRSVDKAAGLGLEIDGVTGHGYLIPYGNTCEFVPGYRGLIELCRRSGQVSSFSAHVARPGDIIDFEFGTESYIKHKASDKQADWSKWNWVYAVVRFKDGSSQFDIMSYDEVIAHKKKYSPGATRSDSPWNTAEIEMAKKTVSRRLVKYLPVSPEILRMAMLDEYHEAGVAEIEQSRSGVKSTYTTPDFFDDEPQQPANDGNDQSRGQQPEQPRQQQQQPQVTGDWKSDITNRFAEAKVKGLAAVENLYDQLAGADSPYDSEQINWITQTRDLVRKRLAEQQGGGKSDRQQKFT